MKALFHTLIFCLCCFTGFAQTPETGKKLKAIPGDYVSVSVDNLDNIYLLSTTNQLKKLSAHGDSLSVFNNVKKFGEATLIDVSNPVKIVLYYKGFSTIAILDGMLNLKTTIDLRRKNMFNVTAAALSYDGKIWLYDDMDNMLKKLDEEGNLLFKTADFRQLFDSPVSPVAIFDQNQYVYLYDSLQGIYVFDYYGSYKNKINITGWQHLHISGKLITGIANGKIYQYNITTSERDEWLIPAAFQHYRQLLFKNDRLYALGKNGLELYSGK